MACEAERQLVEELAAQSTLLIAQMAELQSRLGTWASQMTSALQALDNCMMDNTNPPTPPGP